MGVARRSGYGICLYYLLFNLIFFTTSVPPSAAQGESAGQAQFIKLIAPDRQEVVIAKKPLIEMAFTRPMDTQTLFVMLDGVDISQVLTLTPEGCSFQPVQVLEPGSHTLMVSGTTVAGESFNQELRFSTRHHARFEKAYSQNQLTVLAHSAFSKSDSLDEQVPDWRAEANLNTTSQLQDGGLDLAVNANIKFVDQDIPAVTPENKGVDLINYLLSANWVRGGLTTRAEVGDTLIDLSPNTLSSLNRRGAQLSLGTEMARFGGFSVTSAQTYGYDGQTGIDSDTSRHIHGMYGDFNLLDNRMRLKAIYTQGGEQGDSFGTTATDRNAEGHTAGFVLTTDFFEGRLVSEFESNFARFDDDTTDDQESRSDNAYRLNVQGGIDRYTYSATYKYFGPDYEVVGNQGLEKDRKGIELNGGAGFERHGLSLAYSHFQDNVDNDDTRSVIQTQTALIDYAYSGMERFPISLSYQLEKSDSSKEPSGTAPVDYHTDSLSTTIAYLYNQWNVALQGTYAQMNDMTANDADTTNTLVALMPQYYSEHLSVSPNLSFNQTQDHAADINTDAYTISMEIQGRLPNDKFRYGLGGTLDFTSTSDDSVDQRTTAFHFNLEYEPARFLKGRLVPAIGLRGESNEIDDRINDVITRDYVFMVTLSINSLTSF
ncbi:MAG: hypothetical protein PVH87_07490 [Desulfobacteraceae bacterium]